MYHINSSYVHDCDISALLKAIQVQTVYLELHLKI